MQAVSASRDSCALAFPNFTRKRAVSMEHVAMVRVVESGNGWVAVHDDWKNNVSIVRCNEDVIKPCPRCKHHFGEHTWEGRCLACMRDNKRLNAAYLECGVNMHDAWPDLVPTVMHAV